jgi:hypothetical protein
MTAAQKNKPDSGHQIFSLASRAGLDFQYLHQVQTNKNITGRLTARPSK